MPGKQAKVVTPQMLRRMLRKTSKAPFPARDRVMILLSVKAGLRACEIARLDWSMVLDARGKVADVLAIHDAIAKKRGGRRIPMHPDLRRALQALLRIKRTVGSGHSLRPRRPLAADQRGQLVRGAVQRARLRRAARRTPAGEPSSPPPRATSTAAAAACATCSCSPGTDRSRRPSATSTATPAGRGGWSACCEPRQSPCPDIKTERRGHASLRALDHSPLSRQRIEVEPVRSASARDREIVTWIEDHRALVGSA